MCKQLFGIKELTTMLEGPTSPVMLLLVEAAEAVAVGDSPASPERDKINIFVCLLLVVSVCDCLTRGNTPTAAAS